MYTIYLRNGKDVKACFKLYINYNDSKKKKKCSTFYDTDITPVSMKIKFLNY